VADIDVELESHGKFVVHQAGGDEDALGIAEIEVAMANGVVAEGHIIAIGDDGLVTLGYGEGYEVVRFAGECGGHRHGDRGDHAFEIVVGDGDFTGAGIADAVRGLRNRVALHDLRRAADDRGGGL
jgi:hypothetical protein